MVSTVGSFPADHVSDGPPNGLLRATVTSLFTVDSPFAWHRRTQLHSEVKSQRLSSNLLSFHFFTHSFTYAVCSVADDFTKQMRKVTISSMSVCLSVRPYGTAWLSLEGLTRKSRRRKSGQNQLAFYINMNEHLRAWDEDL